MVSIEAGAVPVELGEAPASTLALTLKAIRGAKSDLRINIYELSSAEIAQAIVDRLEAGVHVDLLLEGQPVGGMSRAEKALQAKIAQAMSEGGCDA
jgi:phosphatidylserine/phosphatidylglycerophosphate/cardiolipin synthase-like enzyme